MFYTTTSNERIHIQYRIVQFKWIQDSLNASTYALDDIYIGQECNSWCSGHGICTTQHYGQGNIQPTCSCDDGYSGSYVYLFIVYDFNN